LAVVLFSAQCRNGGVVNDPVYLEEGKTFAEAAVPAIARSWSAEELLKRVDPEFLRAMPEPQARQMIASCSRQLGPLEQATTQLSTVGINVGPWTGKIAQYVMNLECEKKDGTLAIVVRKSGEQWRILGFHVNIQN
jgi:hypothetical protein